MRSPSRARALLVTGACSGALGVLIASEWQAAVGLLAGAGLWMLVYRRPQYAYLLVLASVAGFVNVYAWPRLSFVPGGAYVSELLLLLAVTASLPDVLKSIRAGGIRVDAIWWAVAGLLVSDVVGVFVGIWRGASASQALVGARPLLFLLAFIPAVAAVATPERRRTTLRWVGLLAVSVGVGAVIQWLVGSSMILFVVGTFDALVREDPATGFFRVRPPGLYLAYAGAVWSAVHLLTGARGRQAWGAGAVLLSGLATILLSLNRNMLVGLLAALVSATIVSERRSRAVFALLIGASLLLGAALMFDSNQLQQPLVTRFASLVDPDQRGQALSDRAYESREALQAVTRDPVVGVGWGPGYGATATRSVGGIVSTFERPWIHNQYLNAWVRMGAFGAVLTVLLFAIPVLWAIRLARYTRGLPDGWEDLASAAALIAFSLSALVDIVVVNPNNLVVVMGMLAIVSVRWSECREAGVLDAVAA